MKREIINARANSFARVAELGMLHAGDAEHPYWNEKACYHFSLAQIEEIEQATAELHIMCLNAVQYVIDNNLFDRLKIPEKLVPYIKQSWEQRDPFIYGRFDLAYDGVHPPKMLEFNADTPTSLLEASLVQYDWLQQRKEAGQLPGDADQFNFVHESLLRAWSKVRDEVTASGASFPKKLHFACCLENPEDAQTTNYIADVAYEAFDEKVDCEVMDISDVGSDGARFYDKGNKPITAMFKLYPWEWLAHEQYGDQILNNRTGFIEPVWKMILSNKGIMAILWEMYPNHKNLIPTYDSPDKIDGAYVKKPLISREGANVSICNTSDAESSGGEYGEEGYVYQQYIPLPNFDGYFPIIGSWVTSSNPFYPDMPTHARGGEACGFGVREDRSRITNNSSQFVPHYFTPTLG